MAGPDTVRALFAEYRKLTAAGVKYRYWNPKAPFGPQFYLQPSELPTLERLKELGANCSSSWNWARRRIKLPGVGGTVAYRKEFLVRLEQYRPGKRYEAGKVLIDSTVIGKDDRSHIAVFSDRFDGHGQQLMLQSDHADSGFGGVKPGVTERRTVRETYDLFFRQNDSAWVGVMPDVGVIPLGKNKRR
jgi:hypothetical protein